MSPVGILCQRRHSPAAAGRNSHATCHLRPCSHVRRARQTRAPEAVLLGLAVEQPVPRSVVAERVVLLGVEVPVEGGAQARARDRLPV